MYGFLDSILSLYAEKVLLNKHFFLEHNGNHRAADDRMNEIFRESTF